MTGSGVPHEPPSLLNPRVPLDLHGIANHPTQHAFLAAGIGALDATPSLGGDNIPRAIRASSLASRGKRRPQTPPERRLSKRTTTMTTPNNNNNTMEEKKERRVEEERRRRPPSRERGATALTRRIGRRGFGRFAGALLTGVAAAFLLQTKREEGKRRRR